MRNDSFHNRRWVIAGVFSVVILVYILRLFSLQIIETKYKIGAESNALLKKTIYPTRGLIYDRNNKLLVYNRPAYDIAMIPREIRNLDTLDFCNMLNITKVDFEERMEAIKDRRKNPAYSTYTPQLFMTQLYAEDIANIQQSIFKFPGFYIQNRTLREYTYPYAAHVFGSIGEVSQKDLENDSYYAMGDYSGRDGVEYTYEKQLRGEKGVEILLRDSRGRIQGKYKNGEADILPVAGKDLVLTIDIQLQQLGEELLNGKIGSMVAIEPSTGEILAMVTNPAYNPAVLVGRARSKSYAALVSDPTKPLLNRATLAQYSPGSTFKPMQALVCQQLGGISQYTYFPCSGQDSKPIRCTHHHGSPVSLLNAIEQSCNPYFWHAFRATLEKDGYGDKNENFKANYEAWKHAMHSFGLGHRFEDSDVFKQMAGNLPTDKYFNRYFGETGWRALTIRSLSIGQGEVLATPLQLANVMALIANDGYYITPHLSKTDTDTFEKHITDVDSTYFPIVKEGMWRVFEYGTGRYFKIPEVVMCGKTGTVQNNFGKDHSLFVGFAPRENPVIAIAVVVENAGFGATWAAPMASLMMEQYVTGEMKREHLYKHMCGSILNTDVQKR